MTGVPEVAPLSEQHDVAGFTSGRPPLDAWLRDQALRAQRAGTARTWVWLQGDPARVVAHYSLAPTTVARDGLPRRATGGYSSVPAYLLARLALDVELQGAGRGARLLWEALSQVLRAAGVAGGRLVVVDALDDQAAAFYQHHGFLPVGGTGRLFLPLDRVAASLGVG